MYDKEQIYDEKISPLMAQIIEICQVNDMQMVASFYLKEATEDEYDLMCTSCLLPKDGQNKTLAGAMHVIQDGYVAQKPFVMAITVLKGTNL